MYCGSWENNMDFNVAGSLVLNRRKEMVLVLGSPKYLNIFGGRIFSVERKQLLLNFVSFIDHRSLLFLNCGGNPRYIVKYFRCKCKRVCKLKLFFFAWRIFYASWVVRREYLRRCKNSNMKTRGLYCIYWRNPL